MGLKKSTAVSAILISVAIMVSAASLYLWQSERSYNREMTASVYQDAFLGFLHSAESACREIEAFDPSSPDAASLAAMTREAELCCFYFSRLPAPYGMLSRMNTFLKSTPEYFESIAENGSHSATATANITSLKVLATKLKKALSDAEGRFLSAEDPYDAVCGFFDRENYVRAGKDEDAFSAFFLDDILYDMPKLSYSGELSTHKAGMGFALLRGAAETDARKAREAAAAYLSQNIGHYRYAGLTDSFPACHIFSFGDAYVSVSRYGGYVMEFSLACKTYESRLPIETLDRTARERAQVYGFGICETEHLCDSAGIAYFSCVPIGDMTTAKEAREEVILGLDCEYGETKYLNAYNYYKYHDLNGMPDTAPAAQK